MHAGTLHGVCRQRAWVKQEVGILLPGPLAFPKVDGEAADDLGVEGGISTASRNVETESDFKTWIAAYSLGQWLEQPGTVVHGITYQQKTMPGILNQAGHDCARVTCWHTFQIRSGQHKVKEEGWIGGPFPSFNDGAKNQGHGFCAARTFQQSFEACCQALDRATRDLLHCTFCNGRRQAASLKSVSQSPQCCRGQIMKGVMH